MHIPLIGKVRRPGIWAIALLSTVLVGGGVATAVVLRQRKMSYDVDALTVLVESQPLAVQITASGTIQPVDTVNLSPRNSDILVSLNVVQGDRVVPGQIIARMKSDSLEAELLRLPWKPRLGRKRQKSK